MSQTIFPVDPVGTAVSIAYRNRRMIADEVLPIAPVGRSTFKYRKFNLPDGFTLPDSKVGRLSQVNQVEFGFTEVPGVVVDHALEDPIPNSDVIDAPEGYDPHGAAAEFLTDLILLNREVRTANLVFGASSYATANKTTLTGTAQWSDYANSNPVDAILTALDGVVMRPNIGVFGQAVWTKLRQHPKVVNAYYGAGADAGAVATRVLADLLELDEIYVGRAFVNTAKKGQTAALAGAWGKSAAFLYRADNVGTATGATFGFTAKLGERSAFRIADPDLGAEGSIKVRVVERTAEVVSAPDLGYLFQAAVA
jgi:hypothetical protein